MKNPESTVVRPNLRLTDVKGLVPTKVFDTYWKFAAERQAIYFRRIDNCAQPWTKDAILQRHRFTNPYRAADRVSQYLIRNVIYQGSQEPKEIFFRTILFKLFNRIETWEALQEAVGELKTDTFTPARFGNILDARMRAGKKIYSAAYIIPAAPGNKGRPKHVGHLELLQRMLNEDLPQKLAKATSLRAAFELLRTYPMMGDFLAYQYIIDLNYSTLLNFSEMEFVVPGPGARNGIKKCFKNTAGLSDADIIRLVTENQQEEFTHRKLTFRTLWGRPLQLIDCQNLFCEVDKYARIAHPEMTTEGGRTRIKQILHPNTLPQKPWFPPKWNINDVINKKN